MIPRRLFVAALLITTVVARSQTSYLFVGTYTYNNSGGKGIYVYKFDASTGKLEFVSHTDSTVVNPTYIAVASNGKHLYATTDTRISKAGSISAFSFEKKTGRLTFLNKVSSGGENPPYLSVNKKGTWVLVANFADGILAALPISKNGHVGEATQRIQHEQKLNSQGVAGVHVHGAFFSADEKNVVVPDPGNDEIAVYNFDEKQKERPLLPNPVKTSTQSASFVRHVDFHPNGKFAYSVQENGTVGVYRYHHGVLDSLQVAFTHNPASTGTFQSSDIHVSPDGLFLYASNRGTENNIAIFSIDQNSGKLKLIGNQSTIGKTPRNFAIEPTGKFLLVANQETGTVVVFKRDFKTGLLTETGVTVNVPQPAVLKFLN